jgi:S-DNA-T family DNA segregation ATPase FtsK/SpoIIIE
VLGGLGGRHLALGAAHQTAEPGVAIISAPGRELARIRAPGGGEYAAFCDWLTAR